MKVQVHRVLIIPLSHACCLAPGQAGTGLCSCRSCPQQGDHLTQYHIQQNGTAAIHIQLWCLVLVHVLTLGRCVRLVRRAGTPLSLRQLAQAWGLLQACNAAPRSRCCPQVLTTTRVCCAQCPVNKGAVGAEQFCGLLGSALKLHSWH